MPREQQRRHKASDASRPRTSALQKLTGAAMVAYGLWSLWRSCDTLAHFGRHGVSGWQIEGPFAWLVSFGLSWRSFLILGNVLQLVGVASLAVAGAALLLRRHRLLSAAIVTMLPWVAISVLVVPSGFVFAFGGATFHVPASAPASDRALAAGMIGYKGVWWSIFVVAPGVLFAAAQVFLLLWLRRVARRWREEEGAHPALQRGPGP
jgi:hypothetical protein